jgi:hypothetical protein
MLSQVRALGKVAHRGVEDERTTVTAGGGVECVLAKRGGEESERSSVIVCHSLGFPVTVWEFGVYCAICAIHVVRASSFLNLMRIRRVVVVCSPSFENFDVFNYYVMFNFYLGPVRYCLAFRSAWVAGQTTKPASWPVGQPGGCRRSTSTSIRKPDEASDTR